MSKKNDERSRVLKAIADCFRSHERFILVSHRNPDGDSISSQVATHLILSSLGKESHMINRDPTPERYRFLPMAEKIRIEKSVNGSYDVAVFLECSDRERSGLDGVISKVSVNIDHHQQNSNFGHINWVEPEACCVGEMIFDLIAHMGIPLTTEIATQIYTAIITDTGSFHYTNASKKAFSICNKLMDYGINHTNIIRFIYEDLCFEKIKLLGLTLSTLEKDEQQEIVWVRIPHDVMEAFGDVAKDTEGFIDFPRSIQGARVAMLIKEIRKGLHKISLRSRDEVDVSQIAKAFGGGGHRNAAGCSIEGSYEEVLQKMQSQIRKHLHTR
jgi:phosphoesterase RecJ-like protein